MKINTSAAHNKGNHPNDPVKGGNRWMLKEGDKVLVRGGTYGRGITIALEAVLVEEKAWTEDTVSVKFFEGDEVSSVSVYNLLTLG